ncbi:hypothetical protein [Acetobacter indonesiensis]|nr:hypothetical protein [Acetobacter indonesiensis]
MGNNRPTRPRSPARKLGDAGVLAEALASDGVLVIAAVTSLYGA